MPSPFEWSKEMDDLFWNCIGRVVLDDPRTDWSENLSFGYPFNLIREQVLMKGLANFDQEYCHRDYGVLTPDEKVLLYCFVNFKKHFFTALATFESHRSAVEELMSSGAPLLLLDIGCGPATACLAPEQAFPPRP